MMLNLNLCSTGTTIGTEIPVSALKLVRQYLQVVPVDLVIYGRGGLSALVLVPARSAHRSR